MHSDPNQIADMSATQELISRGVPAFLMLEAEAQIFVVDALTLRLVFANASALSLLACDMRDIRRAKLWDIFPGLPPDRMRRVAAAIKRRKRRIPTWLTGPYGEGEQYFTVTTLHHQGARKSSLVFTLRDVTRLVAAQADALAARNLLRDAIETLPDGFAYYDADDRLVVCNDMYRDIYDKSADAMTPGTPFRDILQYGLRNGQYPDAIGREAEWLEERMARHQDGNLQLEQRLASGRWIRVVERTTPDGGKVGLRVDITPQKEQQRRLEHMLRTDRLTGLRNRYELADDIAALVDQLHPSERVTIFHIDLDRFKVVNDVYGHAAGDHVLKVAARILSYSSFDPSIVARVGGDEFVAVLVSNQTDNEICDIGRWVQARLSKPIHFRGDICHIGASIGAAFLTAADRDRAAEMLIAADIAMNHAKRSDTSGVVFFEDIMRERTARSTELFKDMKDGLIKGEFRPYFQPQINLKTGKTVGFEALIRWERTDGHAVPAGEFLAVAQNAGLTWDLDQIVLKDACKAVKQLQAWGMDAPCISLNMSLLQINDTQLLDQLDQLVGEFGIARQNLRIELLESTLLDDRAPTMIENVHRLIRAGYLVELDDFGTGHAAIATLRKFAVSQIKIDRSLVNHIDKDIELQTITSAIIRMARSLDISVLAEGVETAEEEEMLQTFQCDAVQGYYHARPMPLEDLRGFLIAQGDVPAPAP